MQRRKDLKLLCVFASLRHTSAWFAAYNSAGSAQAGQFGLKRATGSVRERQLEGCLKLGDLLGESVG